MRDEQASVNQEGKDNSLTALQKDQNLLNPVKVQPRQKSTKSDKYTPQAPDNRYRFRYQTNCFCFIKGFLLFRFGK